MHIELVHEPIGALPEFAAISIGFQVESVLEVELDRAGLGGVRLVERTLDRPYWKDYDIDDTPEVHVLEERRDLGVLWDLRVKPEARGRGVGRALLRRVEEWMTGHGGVQLKIETQNVNVPACRFYVSMGFTLGGLNRFAYPSLPHETQLLWYKSLK